MPGYLLFGNKVQYSEIPGYYPNVVVLGHIRVVWVLPGYLLCLSTVSSGVPGYDPKLVERS